MESMNKPVVIRDTREKKGHGFTFIKSPSCSGTIVDTLKYGDYQIKGLPSLIVIERKQDIDELCANIGANRERFERELQRIEDAGVKFRYIVVEDYYSSIFKQSKYSKMHPNSIFESIMALQIRYKIPFLFCGTHEMAHRVTRSLLMKAYKYYIEGLV